MTNIYVTVASVAAKVARRIASAAYSVGDNVHTFSVNRVIAQQSKARSLYAEQRNAAEKWRKFADKLEDAAYDGLQKSDAVTNKALVDLASIY